MAYRKITVDGRTYEWTAGKTHTKIRNSEGKGSLFLNSEWGTPFGRSMPTTEYVVAPADIRGMILGTRHWVNRRCEKHPDQEITGLTSDPFASEIYGKIRLISNCPKCVQERAWDI